MLISRNTIVSVLFSIFIVPSCVLASSSESAQQPLTIQLLMERIEKLERQVNQLTRQLSTAGVQPSVPSDPLTSSPVAHTAMAPEAPAAETRDYTGLEAAMLQQGGLLLRPGTIEIEPSFTYVNSSNESININGFTILPVLVVGDINSERIRRTSLIPALSLRAGLPNDYQIGMRIPYQFDRELRVNSDNVEKGQHQSGWGDVEFNLAKQFWRQTATRPSGLVQLQWKTNTGKSVFDTGDSLAAGTGFHGVRAGLTFVKTVDPAALFASIGYTYNLPAEKAPGRIHPGDTVDLYLGTSLALASELALNFGYEQRVTNHSTLNGAPIGGTSLEVGTFKTGTTWALSKMMSMDVNIGVGLTRDAPSYSLTVAFPIRLQ